MTSWLQLKGNHQYLFMRLNCLMEKGGQLYCVCVVHRIFKGEVYRFISNKKMLREDRWWGAVVRAAAWLSPIHDYQMIGPQNNTAGVVYLIYAVGERYSTQSITALCRSCVPDRWIYCEYQAGAAWPPHPSAQLWRDADHSSGHTPQHPSLACLMATPPLSTADDFIMELSQMSQFFLLTLSLNAIMEQMIRVHWRHT